MSRIRSTSAKQAAIRSTSEEQPRVEASHLEALLAAEHIPAWTGELRGSPPSLLGVRREIARRLQSSGGRPALDDTTRRQKIPLSEQDWERLEALAERASTGGLKPTPSQIASVLIRQALDALEQQEA
jgi:ribosomal protein L29